MIIKIFQKISKISQFHTRKTHFPKNIHKFLVKKTTKLVEKKSLTMIHFEPDEFIF